MNVKSVGCILSLLSCTMLFCGGTGVQVPASGDKKLFDDLVDVSFTKTKLASAAKKARRIEDLQDLAGRMMRQFVKMLDEEGLKIAGDDKVLRDLQPLLEESQGKRDVLGAYIYAIYQFRLNFYNCKENTFKAKVQNCAPDLKNMLNPVKNTIERAGEQFTLRSFMNYAQKYPKSETLKTLSSALLLTQADITACFNTALVEFNKMYKKVVDAIFAVGNLSAKLPILPVSIDYITNYQDEWQCPICFEKFDAILANMVITPCKHKFHTRCLDEVKARLVARRQPVTCPVCRQKIK